MKGIVRFIVGIILIGAFTFFSIIGNKENEKLDVNALLLSWFQADDGLYKIEARVSLINNTSDTIIFESPECGMGEEFELSTDKIAININCIANKGTWRKNVILPHKTLKILLEICKPENGRKIIYQGKGFNTDDFKNFIGLKFKIGFKLAEKNQDNNGKNITWSNELEISKDLMVLPHE